MKRYFVRPDTRSWTVAAVLAAALVGNFAFGAYAPVFVMFAVLAALALLFFRPFLIPLPRRGTARTAPFSAPEGLLPQLAAKQAAASIADVQQTALGTAFRSEQRGKTEDQVDAILDTCIKLIRQQCGAHTVAVFFPTIESGYRMRRFWSQSGHVYPEAVIQPGLGVLGSLFKGGLKTLNLQEITNDSTTLYYYTRDAGVRSLIACPIMAGNAERGVIVADATEKRAFSEEQLSFASAVATLLGHAVYHAYLYTEHMIEHKQLAEVSNIEKLFFRDLAIDRILDILSEIIPLALPCDRMTISMRSDDGENATIKRTSGDPAGQLQSKRFSLADKTLASILYAKNICISRNFAHDRYEIRYFEKEPRSEEFGSFLGVPLGVDACKGMILIESRGRDTFTPSMRDLVSRIATSAGLAIEKVLILDKANTMATHDGLTGLFNHRQFQQLLKDEILRSTRYSDPLALMLCDIDFFKKVNDTHGHQFGDAVLKEVSRMLDSSIRSGIDTAARYGGEEFALVLVKTDEEQAMETAERIRGQIERTTLRSPTGVEVKVTMSFGIAVFGKHARELDDLIKKADKALYRAKEHGRNRVEVF